MRALRSHTRHLSNLARAIAQIGRAAKTIHLLDYCNDETLRRRILAQLNRGESRHALAREGLPRPPRRAPPALPPRPGRTAHRPRPRRQLHRALQHHLHPACPRPPRTQPGTPSDERARRTAQPPHPRPHHPHRPLPHHASRAATGPRRLPIAQDAASRRGRLTRFSVRTLYRPQPSRAADESRRRAAGLELQTGPSQYRRAVILVRDGRLPGASATTPAPSNRP